MRRPRLVGVPAGFALPRKRRAGGEIGRASCPAGRCHDRRGPRLPEPSRLTAVRVGAGLIRSGASRSSSPAMPTRVNRA